MKKATPDNFAAAVESVLNEYKDRVDDVLGDVIKVVGKEAAKDISRNAPRGRTEEYARSWTSTDTGTRIAPGSTVYSTKPGLPHLLENGHALRGGGRTRAIPHISQVEEALPQMLEDRIRREL